MLNSSRAERRKFLQRLKKNNPVAYAQAKKEMLKVGQDNVQAIKDARIAATTHITDE